MQLRDKWEFVEVFDVSEASRIPKPRLGAIRYLAGACSEPATAGDRTEAPGEAAGETLGKCEKYI